MPHGVTRGRSSPRWCRPRVRSPPAAGTADRLLRLTAHERLHVGDECPALLDERLPGAGPDLPPPAERPHAGHEADQAADRVPQRHTTSARVAAGEEELR